MFEGHYDRLFVEHGPVPPHERSWRHPSELAADELAVLRAEEVPRSTRAFAVATGTLGLVALAVFVLAMTPSRTGTPIAVSATTTEVAVAAGAVPTAVPTIAAVRGPVAVAGTGLALATPIGSGDFAVVIRSSVVSSGGDEVQVLLPSGRVVTGHIVDDDTETALIALADAEPDHEPGHEVAERRPHDREVVTVMASPPITVALADIDALDVADGTAVLDDDGDLVGLCSRDADGTKLLMIDDEIAAEAAGDTTTSSSEVDASSTTAITTTSVPSTSVPDTSVPGTTIPDADG